MKAVISLRLRLQHLLLTRLVQESLDIRSQTAAVTFPRPQRRDMP